MAEFRTVQYQGSQVNRQGGVINVPSGQAALDSDAQYMQRQLQRAGEGIQNNNNLALRQAERLDAQEIANQQLVNQQMSARNDAVLRAEEMYGRQKLANAEMRNNWRAQIGQLQLSQQISSDSLKQQISQQETAALTQLGESVIAFSKTLWQQKANDINKKNEETQAQNFMDELYGLGKTDGADVARVDQAQYSRLVSSGQTEQVARNLESAGQPNDAARLRASDPFALYGRQEAQALQAAMGIKPYLEEKLREAMASGGLSLGDENFNVKQRMLAKEAIRAYVIQNGLHKLPPAIGRKYFAEALLEAEAGIAAQLNKENNVYTAKAKALISKNNAVLAFEEVGRNPVEANKIVSDALQRPGDMEQNLRELYEDYKGLANATGNWEPLKAIMRHGMMQIFEDEFRADEAAYGQRIDAQMEKANKEFYDLQVAQFQMDLRNANPEDVPAIRQRFLELAATMPAKFRNQLEQEIVSARQGDFTSENIELDDIVRRSPYNQVAQNLEAWKKRHPNATPQAIAEADKLIKQYEKVQEPWVKKLYEQFEGEINTAEDPNQGAGQAMNKAYNDHVNEIKRLRKVELENRFKVAMARLGGGASEDAMRQWWAQNNADLKAPIRMDAEGQFPELQRRRSLNPVTSAGPTVTRVQFNGRSVVNLTHPRDQELIIKGQYGRINLQEGAIVLNPTQLQQAALRFSAGEQQSDLVKRGAAAANVTEEAFIRQHLAAYKIPGTLDRPQDPRQTTGYRTGVSPAGKVSFGYAKQFGRQNGLSERGAIWFAQTLMDESGGDPTKTHDGGTGLGLWAARLDRRDKMIAYAQSQGVPPTDPVAQMEYALYEIKKYYPSYWNIITSANPTTNQLFRVSKGWLRFADTYNGVDLNAQRLRKLENVLGR